MPGECFIVVALPCTMFITYSLDFRKCPIICKLRLDCCDSGLCVCACYRLLWDDWTRCTSKVATTFAANQDAGWRQCSAMVVDALRTMN